MDFLWKTIYLLVICVLQMPAGLYGKPDIEYFMKAKCPASEPNKCPPKALCHNYEHYCDEGVVKSCIPISTNDTAILEWCEQSSNISNLLDATCRFACHSKFHSKFVAETSPEKRWSLDSCFPHHKADDSGNLLSLCQKQIKEDFTSLPHPSCKYVCIDKFNASALYQCSPGENGISSVYPWAWVLVIVLLVINIALLVYLHRTRRGQHPPEVDTKAPDDRNKEKQPAASSGKDSKENDIKTHQRVPEDEKLLSGANCDLVPDKNSNVLKGVPENQSVLD